MERRKYNRLCGNFEVLINFYDRPVTGNTNMHNLSAGGMLFDYKEAFNLNSIINLRFLKPKSFEFFQSDARVVRVEINPDNKTYDIGVEFLNISEEDKMNLDYLLNGQW